MATGSRHLRLVPGSPQTAPVSVVVEETGRLYPLPGIPEPVADLQPSLCGRVPVQPHDLGAVQATRLDAEPGPRVTSPADPGGASGLDGERPQVGRITVAGLLTGLWGALTWVDWVRCLVYGYCVAFWVIVAFVLSRYA